MSTNYYFEVRDADKIVEQIKAINPFITEKTLTRIKDELTEIHIGKRSGGWKPLFEASEHFSNMEELEIFYNTNKDSLIIKSEYGYNMTWEELTEELFEWGKGDRSSVRDAIIEGYMRDNDYYIDEQGYEWCKHEFS